MARVIPQIPPYNRVEEETRALRKPQQIAERRRGVDTEYQGAPSTRYGDPNPKFKWLATNAAQQRLAALPRREARPVGRDGRLLREREADMSYRDRSTSRGRGGRGRGISIGRGSSREEYHERRIYGKGHTDQDDMDVSPPPAAGRGRQEQRLERRQEQRRTPDKKKTGGKDAKGAGKPSRQNVNERLNAPLGTVPRVPKDNDGDNSGTDSDIGPNNGARVSEEEK
jgi:hypothetical protein